MRLTWPAALRRRISWAFLVSLGFHVFVVAVLLNLIKLPARLHQKRGDSAVFVELQRPEERAPLGNIRPPLAPPRAPRSAPSAAQQQAPARPSRVGAVQTPSPPTPPRPQPPAEKAPEPARGATPQPAEPDGMAQRQAAKSSETQAPAPPTPTPPAQASGQRAAPVQPSEPQVAKAPAPDLRAFRRGPGGTGTVSGLGGGRGGIVGEPVSLDTPDPRFAEYLARVKEKIIANWGFPCVEDHVTRTCDFKNAALVIEFGILKDGRVQFVELRSASGPGLEIYDAYALNAIKLSSPFPEIPRDIMLALKGSTGIPISAIFTYTAETSIRNLLR